MALLPQFVALYLIQGIAAASTANCCSEADACMPNIIAWVGR